MGIDGTIDLGREPILISRWGSRHFGLHNDNSDHDINIFVAPTLEDLISKNDYAYFKQHDVGGTIIDVSCRDILTFGNYLNQMNFVNMLFAPLDHDDSPEIIELISMRNEIAVMNLPSMYNHTIKKARNDIHSYHPKDWYHGVRMFDALIRFEESGWDMLYAMTYFEEGKDELLEIKEKRDPQLAHRAYRERYNKVMGLHQQYFKHPRNKDTEKKVNDLINSMVRNYVKEELTT